MNSYGDIVESYTTDDVIGGVFYSHGTMRDLDEP
jgi:hypothetical protein